MGRGDLPPPPPQFLGDSNNLKFLKNIHTFGPLKFRRLASGQRHRRRNIDHTCFWHPHLHSLISLSLSFSDFLIYHFQPRHYLVGLLFIFSSSLPLRLDRQLFMMFPCPRDFTLQIWDYIVCSKSYTWWVRF